MFTPAPTPADLHAHATFMALMWAFSYPGRPHHLPTLPAAPSAMLTIGEALIDLETSFFTPDADLERLLLRTGARRRTADLAMYQFFPQLEPADLDFVRQAPIGSLRDPDQAATLIIGCQFGQGASFELRGPGIQQASTLQVAGLPRRFWQIRAQQRYPLGWDVLLVDHTVVIGLPRTTRVRELDESEVR
ncbi:MAG: phosphonate C-P lyase system protein PhnH [Roseiflexaceae bacterium]